MNVGGSDLARGRREESIYDALDPWKIGRRLIEHGQAHFLMAGDQQTTLLEPTGPRQASLRPPRKLLVTVHDDECLLVPTLVASLRQLSLAIVQRESLQLTASSLAYRQQLL
jgi:hypothetical protein